MARQQNNSVMYGTTGLFNKQVVFKNRKGRVYVAGPPTIDPDRKPTADQLVQYEKFSRCIQFVKKMTVDPDLKAIYDAGAKTYQTAANAAFQDAYYAPKVLSISNEFYEGTIGNAIPIQATDNFKVSRLTVSIFNAQNVLIEQGNAFDGGDGLNWEYITTLVNPAIDGSKIIATAYDHAGNSAFLELVL